MKYSSEIMYISNIACLFEILGNYVLGVCVLILYKKKNYLDFKSMDEDCQTRWKLFSGSYFVLILKLRLFCQHMRSSFD